MCSGAWIREFGTAGGHLWAHLADFLARILAGLVLHLK